jgi:RNA polymerase sigma-70 factor, ECF subfamily
MPENGVLSHKAVRSDVTVNLLAWSAGDDHALHTVFAALHERLSRLATRALSAERANHTLDTTGVISETYLRMLEQQHVEWRSREQFIATAAQMMRRILIDYARARRTAKRGRDVPMLPLSNALVVQCDLPDEVTAIRDALEALAAVDRALAEIIELRFFGGMTHDQIAGHLGLSVATIERRWRLGRAWLYRYLEDP